MSQVECRSELVQRERRGQLSNSERIALDAHVRSCEACRLLQVLGADFDDWSPVDSADAQRLERMMRFAEHWVEKPRRLARPTRMRWLLAAMGTTLAAAATTVAVSRWRWVQPPPAEGTTAPATPPDASGLGSSSAMVTAPPSALEANASASSAALPPPAMPDRAMARSVSSWSAEQLLQKANIARRNGDAPEAIRLFRRLQRDFASSREAGLSFVALGTLLLEQGQASLALEQFNRYLSTGPNAALTAEALYGKGRALGQLGQLEQERQIWNRLLAQYPKSPYASHAKRRLLVDP